MNTKANYCKFQSYRIAKIATSTKPSCLCTATTNTMQIVIKKMLFLYICEKKKQKKNTNGTTLNQMLV